MRTRTAAVLSFAALAAVALAGCSSPAPSPTPTESAVDLCTAKVAPGAASDAVTVSGEAGAAPTAAFAAPLDVTSRQSTQVTVGTGPTIANGDTVYYAFAVYNAATGAQTQTAGYGDATLDPVVISPDIALGPAVGCATVGSRFVATFPSEDGSTAASVYVIDVLGIMPQAATGEPQEPVSGMPTVVLDDTGAPTVTMPGGTPPNEVQIADLKKGDGAVVGAGDRVTVQYTGALWSDGSVFDSSWTRGAPATFATTGVVPGFRAALEGQAVGSQVLVVIPPAAGYGDEAKDKIPAGSTLVFVIDILATSSAG